MNKLKQTKPLADTNKPTAARLTSGDLLFGGHHGQQTLDAMTNCHGCFEVIAQQKREADNKQ